MTDQAAVDAFRERVVSLLDTGRAACRGYDREDLIAGLDDVNTSVLDPATRVVICGEFKKAKSSLVNSLLKTEICPVDDDIATAVPTSVARGETRFEAVSLPSGAASEGAAGDEPMRRELQGPHVRSAILDPFSLDPPADLIEATLPSGLPDLVLIDTPGTGGLGSVQAKATLATLPTAQSAVFVSDASQEYTEAELSFLQRCIELCPQVICVMTKIDLHPHWRTILQANTEHLASLGIELAIMPVSSLLFGEGHRHKLSSMIEESGIPALLTRLGREVAAVEARRVFREALEELHRVLQLLRAPFDAERTALTDPTDRDRALAELEAAQEHAASLRSATARWQVMLNDGVSDLMSDVDHDFRNRMRDIGAEANAVIDEGAPLEIWSEFAPWFEQRVADEILLNFELLSQRAEALNAEVGALFADEGGTVTAELGVFDPTLAMARVSDLDNPEFSTSSRFSNTIAGLRGGHSGMFMFQTISGLALGAAAITPVGAPIAAVTAVVALISGRSAVKQGAEREVAQHRTAAKAAIRSYTDEVTFRMGKELQATMRAAQRMIRDHYTVRAEELHTTGARAIEAATAAARSADPAANAARVADIDAELGRIGAAEVAIATLDEELR
ncbi:MAG: dynamin family protein [Actinomycetota bacterium]